MKPSTRTKKQGAERARESATLSPEKLAAVTGGDATVNTAPEEPPSQDGVSWG